MANSNTPSTDRGHWSGHIGLVLAAAGSAIGLGNIWKFPYITGVYGGGAFVLVYLGCVVIVGLPIMISELAIGRSSQLNPVGAFQKLHHKGSVWQIGGWLGIATGFLILAFYSVIAGKALAYVFKAISGFSGSPEMITAQYDAMVADPWISILWHTVFMVLTIAIVAGGVQKGIERWARILMPSLFVLLLGLMIYALAATDGGAQALAFLFKPNFSQLSAEGVLSALGHAFFTLSLGMGVMITYGSYMAGHESIVRDSVAISIMDTVVALMAGIVIFALVFSHGLAPDAGPGLIFHTLPVLFAQTGPLVSVPFFILLTFAALTSTISLLEVVASYFVDMQGWRRTRSTIVLGGAIWALGLLCAIDSVKLPFRGSDQTFFDIFDFVTTNYMLPIGGLLICLFFGWIVKEQIRREEIGSHGAFYRVTIFILRFVAPVAVLIILLHGLELLPFMDYGK